MQKRGLFVGFSFLLSVFVACGSGDKASPVCDPPCDTAGCEACIDGNCVYQCTGTHVCDGEGNCVVPHQNCDPPCDAAGCEACIDGNCVFQCTGTYVCDGESNCVRNGGGNGLPSGDEGIAAQYPGDIGIENDPSVILVEMFEVDSVSVLEDRWDEVRDANGNMSISSDVPPDSPGQQSLLIRHVGGQGTGAHLHQRLLPGYDKLHYRFYTKLASGAGPLHHFFTVGARDPVYPWPMGGAGTRPAGDDRMSVSVGPHYTNGDRWGLYSYWMDMRGSPPAGATWGNLFLHNLDPPHMVFDEWVSVELMIKMNDVEQWNGEKALWINGELVAHLYEGFARGKWVWDRWLAGEDGEELYWCRETDQRAERIVEEGGEPFEGFRLRSVDELKLNYVWGPKVYITGAENGHVSEIWHDHLVIATDYIGPLAPVGQ